MEQERDEKLPVLRSVLMDLSEQHLLRLVNTYSATHEKKERLAKDDFPVVADLVSQ